MPLAKAYNQSELQTILKPLRLAGRKVAFIPTMGNLHPGHLSLVSLAREHADFVVVSIFVNPTQFGPSEDFANYPRTIEADQQQLQDSQCDLLFLPTNDIIYPYGVEKAITVQPPSHLTNRYCGASRLGHFDGVISVVARLFNLVLPDIAIFGEKDYQQLQLIRYLCSDLGYDIQVIGAPIMREASGLAMSSRNNYLTDTQRQQASALYQSLLFLQSEITKLAANNDLNIHDQLDSLLRQAKQIQTSAGLKPEYLFICNSDTLDTIYHLDSPLRLLTAAQLGGTRLIDNISATPLLQKNNTAQK